MMELQDWLAFSLVAALVIVTPGPAALLCLRHGLQHGRRRALATVLGGTLSAALLMALSMLGVWQLLVAAPTAFDIARGCGATWLLWLGVDAWRSRVSSSQLADAEPQRPRPLAALCRDGFLLGVCNPKDLLFFGALLPQFVEPEAAQLPQLACMFVTWALIDGLAMGGYAVLGHRLLGWLACSRRLRWFQRTSGAGLVICGLALAVAQPVPLVS